MNGWFKFHRAMLNHPVWSLSDGQFKVWITILAQANHRARDWWDGGERVTIPAGSLVRSQRGLAEDAKVSRIVVRHALSNLRVLGSIRAQRRAQHKVLIEVVNWPSYQGSDAEESPEASPERAQGEPSVSPTGRTREGEEHEKGEQYTPLPQASGGDALSAPPQYQAETKALVDFWSRLYQERVGCPPEIRAQRELACAKAILRGRTLKQAKAIVRYHFEHPGDLYREKRLYGLNHIRKDCNQIIARMRTGVATSAITDKTRQNLDTLQRFVERGQGDPTREAR